jgi:antitoxin ParD1/3/4
MADIHFAPNAEDERIIRLAMREGERPSDVIRRALRLLQRQMWQDRLSSAPRPAVEDLS